MLIFIISCIVLIAGIALLVLGNKFGWYWDCEWAEILGVALTFIGGIAVLVSIILTATVQLPKENDYQNALYLRESLEYRLEHKNENTIGNELLYSEIVEYNNSLRTVKRYADNPWLNWFHNDKIATLDYIELEEVGDYEHTSNS